jgi:tetratricopeptide (TPR) repeat protein
LPRSVQVVGEVIEPVARRAIELAEMNRRLAAEPDDAEALIHRGWLFAQQRKWPEAITDLEHRLRLRPGDPEAYWLLAQAYLGRGKLADALTALSRLLDQAPHDHDVRFERGLVALAARRPNLAREDFSQILAAEPDDDEARYPLAQSLIRVGRHREALAELDILIRNRPSGYWLPYLRSTVRDALGDHEQARADEEKAKELMRNEAATLNDQAWVDATGPITKRDPDRSLILARRAVALLPDRRFLNTLGVALYRVGQYAESISVLDQSLATGKGESAAYDLFLLAMAHQKLGHSSQARVCFDRAVGWCGEQKNLPADYVSELTDFRAEAEDVLADSRAELPADVFAPE